MRDFSRGPVVRTWHFDCWGWGSIPGQGTKILQVKWCGLKKKSIYLYLCSHLISCSREHSWEFLGLQGDPTSTFWRRSALGFLWKEYAKAETPVLWPPHAKSWLIGKDSDSGRDWGQEEKGTTEDEMAGWHHWLNGRESEWTPGVGDGQGGLACCDSWGRKESDTTERLNWTEDGPGFPYSSKFP